MSKKSTMDPNAGKDVDLGEVYTGTELFLEKHKQAITIAVVGVVVVIAGLLGYRKLYAEPRAAEAAELMWKAEYYFEVDSLDRALHGDDIWPGFLTIASEYGGTPGGKLSHYYLGAIYMRQGEWDAAIDHYRKAKLKDDVLRTMAVGNIGDAMVELGRTDEAVKQFEKAAGMIKNDFTTPLFLMKAGILHQQAGNWGAAAKAFKRIAQEFPTSNEASQARKYAGRAEAMGG
jgi:tetratricopeptide (TPR) repeat protein